MDFKDIGVDNWLQVETLTSYLSSDSIISITYLILHLAGKSSIHKANKVIKCRSLLSRKVCKGVPGLFLFLLKMKNFKSLFVLCTLFTATLRSHPINFRDYSHCFLHNFLFS